MHRGNKLVLVASTGFGIAVYPTMRKPGIEYIFVRSLTEMLQCLDRNPGKFDLVIIGLKPLIGTDERLAKYASRGWDPVILAPFACADIISKMPKSPCVHVLTNCDDHDLRERIEPETLAHLKETCHLHTTPEGRLRTWLQSYKQAILSDLGIQWRPHVGS
jgi:hypothetical protein